MSFPTEDKDAYGNYIVSLPAQPASAATGFGIWTSGSGAPTSAPTSFEIGYVDTSSGAIYVNDGGSWVLSSASNITSVAGVYAWDGTGAMPSPAGPAICLGSGAQEGNIWYAESAGGPSVWIPWFSV